MPAKTYEIHDNGGRPFVVTIEDRTVTVEKQKEEEGEVQSRKKLFAKTVDEVFLGKKSPKGGYDGLNPSQAEGNSILLHHGAKYIYIGSEIYEFSPVKGDTIEAYYSDIGNSDVPYPYAIGKTHVYIMLEKVAVEKSFFDMKRDIYHQYYSATTYLPMCLKGHGNPAACKDKEAAKDIIEDLHQKQKKLRTKVLQKRLY
jgi:hypothetical protein